MKSTSILSSTLYFMIFISSLPGFALEDKQSIANRIEVLAPRSGIERIEVRQAGSGQMFGVVAHYRGAPLPAVDSILLAVEPSKAEEIFASYLPGIGSYLPEGLLGLLTPYWTAPGWTDALSDLPARTQFVIWREAGGSCGAMIPLVGGGMRCLLDGDGERIRVRADSLSQGHVPRLVPMFAIGWGDDPYRLIEGLYQFALKVMHDIDPTGVIGRPRVEKGYPEIFRYIGWCSWNAHYQDVSESDIIASAASFKQAGFPVRWILIDDGWLSTSRESFLNWGNLYLTDFEANARFPGGLAQTTRILKEDYGITWVGVWHTFQGYWNGVARDSRLGRDYADDLLAVSKQAAIPNPRSGAGQRFWEDWYAFMAGSGIDFVKVDNQSMMSSLVGDDLPVSQAMAQAQDNLQNAAERHFNSSMINCMEMNIDVVYQWKTTNIGRSSVDYLPNIPSNPRNHVLKNVFNALWFQNLTYPDYDMWMTNDRHAQYHAVARAISGGPIYITDKAGQERFDLLWPLILSDGRIIMVDSPGLPTARSIFNDPRQGNSALTAFARAGSGGVIAGWNVNRMRRPVSAKVSPSDVAGIRGERFVVYEYFSGEMKLLNRYEELESRLKGWEVRLWSVVPIEHGFAAIGLSNKFVAPGTVKDLSVSQGRAVIRLAEGGPFLAWCEKPPVSGKVDGSALADSQITYNSGMLKIDVPAASPGEQGPLVEIRW